MKAGICFLILNNIPVSSKSAKIQQENFAQELIYKKKLGK